MRITTCASFFSSVPFCTGIDVADCRISLITESSGLIKQPLGEGAWEGLYYPILDKCFTNLGELMLQRHASLDLFSQHLSEYLAVGTQRCWRMGMTQTQS